MPTGTPATTQRSAAQWWWSVDKNQQIISGPVAELRDLSGIRETGITHILYKVYHNKYKQIHLRSIQPRGTLPGSILSGVLSILTRFVRVHVTVIRDSDFVSCVLCYRRPNDTAHREERSLDAVRPSLFLCFRCPTFGHVSCILRFVGMGREDGGR